MTADLQHTYHRLREEIGREHVERLGVIADRDLEWFALASDAPDARAKGAADRALGELCRRCSYPRLWGGAWVQEAARSRIERAPRRRAAYL